MEILAIIGVALFIIIVGAVMYVIFGDGDIGTASMMLMGVVMVSAIGLALFMGLAAILPNTETIDIDNSAPRGLFSGRSFIEVTNITICSSGIEQTSEPCPEPQLQYDTNIVVYWKVPNSIGCCATYGCLYPAFEAACLNPFRLYNIYLDDIMEDMDAQMGNYEYTCSYAIPWNWHTFNNVPVGRHTIRIEQKNCVDIVATAEITFTINDLGEGIYFVGVNT